MLGSGCETRFRNLHRRLPLWLRSGAFACVSVCLCLAAQPASAATYALLVGIDDYQGANPPGGGRGAAAFGDLSGAKADVARMREVLGGRKIGLAVNDPSKVVVLEDQQATRAAIGGALNALIVRAAREPNSTVLFYYSGHGARVKDDVGDQASGFASTIVPYDGRVGGQPMRDIAGRELRRVFDRANSWGVNIVTIFDSCNAGTATRGVTRAVARDAPAFEPDAQIQPLAPPTWPSGPEPRASAAGARVHLAAAESGESATERPGEPDGHYRGDFTEALADALTELPQGSTYQDVMARVRDKLEAAGVLQHPHMEGALNTHFLGRARVEAALYAGELGGLANSDCATAGVYCVAGGALSGVTAGSQFDVYASATDAVDQTHLAARGQIAEAGASVSRLQLTSTLNDVLPAQAWLRETSHDYGALRLRLYVDGSAQERTRIQTLLSPMDAIQWADRDHAQLVVQAGAGGARLMSIDGVPLSARFAKDADLTAATRRAAQFYALLDLPHGGLRLDVKLDLLPLCPQGKSPCPDFKFDGTEYVLSAGDQYTLQIENDELKGAYYVYVWHLGSDFSVEGFFPPSHASDRPLGQHGGAVLVDPEGYCATVPPYSFESEAEKSARGRNERDRFLLIATDNPIDLSALAQDGVTRGAGPSPLERLLIDAQAGRRSAHLVQVGLWSVSVLTVRTQPSSMPCPAPQ